ncbi:MAG: outer membrane lipoprotein chaperone LolA [Thiobacillaceae bacterium]|nr:outer membrane lipoprotein chaperone LolA [Thiobacillaceae bacterium]
MLIVVNVTCAYAGAEAQLREFISGTRSLSARFEQQVYDRAGRKIQDSAGSMQFSRPGKFRWVYEKPYKQLVVGDGSKLWIHDQDLEQVTVRKLDQAIGESPAALLAGSNDIEKFFVLKEGGSQDGLEWLEATPRSREGSFELVRMGFKNNDVRAMVIRDNFGQTTRLRFTGLKKNPSLAGDAFRFTPPKGVDVIGDER